MKIQLVYNPHSGGGRGDNLAPLAIKALQDAGHQVTEHRTLYHDHATEIVRHLDLNTCDALVSVGGDGTMYEVLNGLIKNEKVKTYPTFGIIPVGTGNSFSQDIGMRTWRDGVTAISEAKKKQVDVIKFTTEGEDYYSLNCIGFGLPTDVCVYGNKYKKFLGKAAYTASALIEIMRFKPFHTKLEVDGVEHEFDAALANFSNSTIFGGNMKISPNSVIDDGLIELIILNNCKKGEIIKALPTLYTGNHLSNPHIKVYQGKHFKVETFPEKTCNPEGEIFGVTPLEVIVLPKKVELFVKESK
ncbi:MAG: diacylglycerol kinase family protein [Candidatus Marinimicrobia bacterium]|nr:diacylglycerol kinase family protein [Candidatus Neomarinimicrobiota bacterium]